MRLTRNRQRRRRLRCRYAHRGRINCPRGGGHRQSKRYRPDQKKAHRQLSVLSSQPLQPSQPSQSACHDNFKAPGKAAADAHHFTIRCVSWLLRTRCAPPARSGQLVCACVLLIAHARSLVIGRLWHRARDKRAHFVRLSLATQATYKHAHTHVHTHTHT